jgi:hypothetical protein
MYCDDVCREASRHVVLDAKSGGACAVCGYNWGPALEFHHVFPETKRFDLSAVRGASRDEVVRELGKCLLLCCNCHREVHSGKRGTITRVFELYEAIRDK